LGNRLFFNAILTALFCLVLATAPARAQQARTLPPLIRDAEIESIIRTYTTPIFEAAGLDVASVRVILLNDLSINAFVAGGMNLFINAGLIVESDSPGEIIGVIAHEAGHIAGGHLVRRMQEQRSQYWKQAAGILAGIAAVVASGQGNAGMAVFGAAAAMSQADFLSFSRTQEISADQAGLTFLDRTHQSARPLLDFLQMMQQRERILSGPNLDPYLRTHPLTQDRLHAVAAHIARSPYSDVPTPAAEIASYQRMRAKLIGYLEPLPQVLQRYPESDQGPVARYGRSFAYWQAGDMEKAIATIKSLLDEQPDDAYYNEFMGQLLFQSGRGAAALPYYEKSVALAPEQPMLRLGLAQAQVEIGGPALNKAAIPNLEEVVRIEPFDAPAWRTLAIAYGRDGQLGMAALSLAEAAQVRGDTKEAKMQADRALRQLPVGSPAALRAQDIIATGDSKG
jgi:predicted Zn-dependent protease